MIEETQHGPKDIQQDENRVGKDQVNTIENVRYLVNKGIEEGRFYWIRTNIFFVLNAGLFALFAPRFDSLLDLAKPSAVLMSALGVVICVAWLISNRDSQYNYLRFYADARNILRRSKELHGIFDNSLFAMKGEWKYHYPGSTPCDSDKEFHMRPWLKMPILIYYLAVLFGLGWLSLFLIGVCSCP